MGQYRKYTKRQKLAAVMAAEVGGVVMAEKQTGIRESTIRYWRDQPEFAEFRARTREDLHDEIKTVAHLAWQRTAEALAAGTMDPRDMLFAAEKSTSIMLLMAGEATSRNEVRDITSTLDDHELATLKAIVQGGHPAEHPAEVAVVDSGQNGTAPA